MNLEEWKILTRKLTPYFATTTDQKSVLVRPRTIGANPDLITPLYWDAQFFELLGTALAGADRFIAEANLPAEPGQYQEGRVAKYIADGLLGANGIEVPRQFKDRLFLLAIFPHLVENNPHGALLTYFLDSDQRTAQEKIANTRKVALDRKRTERFRR